MTRAQQPPPIVEGNKFDRKYCDMLGRSLAVGDYFVHSTARSSSVYVTIYKIKAFVDLDSPAYLGSVPDGDDSWRRVESWDAAFKLKAIAMEHDRVTGKLTIPRKWDRNLGQYVEQSENEAKPVTISAVERVVRLDLDV